MPVHLSQEQMAQIEEHLKQMEILLREYKSIVGTLAGHIVPPTTIGFDKDPNGNWVSGALSSNPKNSPNQPPNVNVYPGLTFTALPPLVNPGGSHAPSTLPRVFARDPFPGTGIQAKSQPNVITPYETGSYYGFDDAITVIQVEFDPKWWIRHVSIDVCILHPDANDSYVPQGAPYLKAFDKSNPAILLGSTSYQGADTPGAWQTLTLPPTAADIGVIQFGCPYDSSGIAMAMFDNLHYSTSSPWF